MVIHHHHQTIIILHTTHTIFLYNSRCQPWHMMIHDRKTFYSYKIMCPKELKGVEKDIKATEIIIRYIDLPEDQYRIGRTKVDRKKIKRK